MSFRRTWLFFIVVYSLISHPLSSPTTAQDGDAWFYAASGELTWLPYPEREFRHYYELLPDNTLLLITYDREGEVGTSQRFWRYDPIADRLEPTLPQGWWGPITFPELEQYVFSDP